ESFPEPRGLVNDFADVIPPEAEEKTMAVASEVLSKTGIPIVVVTMPDIGGSDYNQYANRLYESWGIGREGVDKGVLVFVTVKERKMRIEVGYGLEGIIPDGLAGEIRDRYMIPYLQKDRYGEGILNGALALASVIARHEGIELTGRADPVEGRPESGEGGGGLAFLPLILVILFLFLFSRRRGGGAAWLLLPLLMGGGPRVGRGGGDFGGFSGGFGGFGGGMSGGGGAGGGF
ncbi:MAG: TPM domain-containing protein, partial [Desulfobacteraceae bacterium]